MIVANNIKVIKNPKKYEKLKKLKTNEYYNK